MRISKPPIAAAFSSSAISVVFAVFMLMLGLPGCADDAGGDGGDETAGTGGVTTSAGTGSGSGGADSTGTGGSTGGQLEVPDPPTDPTCNPDDDGDPISGTPFSVFRDGAGNVPTFSMDLAELGQPGICPGLTSIASPSGMTRTLDVQVFRPDADGMGAWPSGPVPLVIHHHGLGQNYLGYEYIGELLASRGYAFLSVRVDGQAQQVADTIACTMSWLGSEDPQGGAQVFMTADDNVRDMAGNWSPADSRLRCSDTVIMGHSHGAGPAISFLRNRDLDNLSEVEVNPERLQPYWFDFEPAAFVGFASFAVQDPLPAELAVPFLMFGAGADTDPGGVPKQVYDLNPREENRNDVARFLFWVLAEEHDAFGGITGPGGEWFDADSTGGTIAVAEYLPRFLEWQVEGDNVEENRRVLQQETFPGPLNDPKFYEGNNGADGYGAHGYYACRWVDEATCDSKDGCFWDETVTPVRCQTDACHEATSESACDAIRGCHWDTTDGCVDLDCELHVFGDCEAVPGCVEWNCGQDLAECEFDTDCCSGACTNDECVGDGNQCRARPSVYVAFTPDTTGSLDFAYPIQHFTDAGSECDAIETTLPSGQLQCGPVEDLVESVGANSIHQTAAMMAEWGDGSEGTVSLVNLAETNFSLIDATHLSFRVGNVRVPVGVPACTEPEEHPLDFGVRLRSEGQLIDVPVEYVTTPLIPPQQDVHHDCPQTTMTTVRIDMASLCANDELDTSMLHAIDFLFEDRDLPRAAVIDTVEFTYTNDDYPELACSPFSGMYACPTTGTFEAELTTCGGEPVSGVCQVGDIMTDNVDPPEVFDGTSNIDGWLVHVGTGVIDDPMTPTTSELAYIQGRCLEACENEWVDDSDIRPNCGDSGALGNAYFVSSPSLGARQAIPVAQRDGSGIFAGEAVSCSLNSDCCFEFDEDLCTAAPDRVTPQMQPLGTHEEYRVIVNSSQSHVESTSGMTSDTASLDGEIGYSLCRDGSASGPCPFYLGSVHLEATSSLDVDVECPDGSLETITIDDLEVDLAQPAMGIDQTGTLEKGFPTRSLVLDATFEVSTQPYAIRGLNEIPVLVSADPDEFDALDIPFRGEAPCTSGGVGTTRGQFDISLRFSAQGTVGEPPTVDINMPTSTTCGFRETFSAVTSDPDNDIVSTRWYVDDVLMDAGETYVYFNTAHTVRAVVRDARGATATDEVTITCT